VSRIPVLEASRLRGRQLIAPVDRRFQRLVARAGGRSPVPQEVNLSARCASISATDNASGQQYRAITGDMGRLMLLVEPHPATPSHQLDLHGLQEVRGRPLRRERPEQVP
jgi:hypothetical protein